MRQAFRIAIAAIALMPLAPAAADALTFKPGDPRVSGAHLQPYENAWVYSATLPDGSVHVQGIWTDHFSRIALNGKSLWRRIQGMTYVTQAASSVSDVFDPDTCMPVSNEQHHPDESVLKRTFEGAHVTTERVDRPGAAPTRTGFDLPEPVFDFFGGTYGILLSCLPLTTGLTATLPAIDETKDSFKPFAFSVLRKERTHAGRLGNVDTFVVFVDTPGEYSQTFWLSKEPPYIIRLQVAWADKHAVATFDML
jgi:hypothetical protein